MCFYEFKCLLCVTFGKSSSLKRIHLEAFFKCDLIEIHIPDSDEKLGDQGFYECRNLSRVTFGNTSSLKRIGNMTVMFIRVTEIHLPDSVEYLCDKCFHESRSLFRVIFGKASLLKWINCDAFHWCLKLTEIIFQTVSKNFVRRVLVDVWIPFASHLARRRHW